MEITSASYSEFIPGSYVSNKNNLDWGIGQVQSCIKKTITVNFENVGKKVMSVDIINFEIIKI